ncbi:MAG: outer membrane beta-barrel protein [Aureibaculum sp.]|nr:outer membrane beta-barrel protein [Aureibaculum sp.]
MKKLLFIITLTLYTIVINAQLDLNYGLKTGLNYNTNGDLAISGGFAGLNEKVNSERDFGFHVGMYAQLNFTKLYVRPELVFTKTKSTYNNLFSPSSELKMSTIEIPILVGFTIVKPLSVYIGPSFKYILDNEFSTDFDLNIEKEVILGLNVGVTLQLLNFGFDLRYSPGLTENLAVYVDDLPVDGLGYSIDTKSDQIIFSFSYQFN